MGSTSGRLGHVQGLRAVAVLAVVLFHAGAPLPGGFVGVDVFFVISGFVITRMLLGEARRDGRIDLRRFYVRRIRRLLPASAVLVAVTVAASALLLSPVVFTDQVVPTAAASMVFVANWAIAHLSGAYFGPQAEDNPLLHMWSLSVEEQFYLLVPSLLALALGRRVPPRHRLPMAVLATGGVTLVSLALIRAGDFGITLTPFLAGFYSPLLRAWEFGAGALLALVTSRWTPRSPWAGRVAAVVGSALVGWALLGMDQDVPWPGKATLVPVLGTALLVLAGLVGNDRVTRLLSTRPATAIGDLSYSLYLWHWPLIVIVASAWPTWPPGPAVSVGVAVLAAWVSYRRIEQPFRTGRVGRGPAGALRLGGLFAAPLALTLAGFLIVPVTTAPPYQEAQERLDRPAPRIQRFPCTATALARVIGSNGQCVRSAPTPEVEVALVGDSHAEHLYAGMVDQLGGRPLGLYALRSPRFFGGEQNVGLLLDALDAQRGLSLVVVARQWNPDGLAPGMVASVDRIVAHLTARGVRVVLADDVADYPFAAVQCAYRAAPVLPTTYCDAPATRYEGALAAYGPQLDALAERYGARRLALGPASCPGRTCSMTVGGLMLYRDSNHLSEPGSRWVLERAVALDPGFAALLRG